MDQRKWIKNVFYQPVPSNYSPTFLFAALITKVTLQEYLCLNQCKTYIYVQYGSVLEFYNISEENTFKLSLVMIKCKTFSFVLTVINL